MGRFDGKTEKATPQRRRKARREGTVARSAEVGSAAILVSGLVVVKVLGPQAVAVVAEETRVLLGTPLTDGIVPGSMVIDGMGRMALAAGAPFLAGAFVIALAAGFAQVGFAGSPQAAKPKLSNLHPRRGLDKLKPSNAGWELVRTAVKLGLLTALVWGPLTSWQREPARARSLDAGLGDLWGEVWAVLVRAALLAALVAVADYAWNRWRTTKQMRMSKDEVRQEHKDNEGDPHVKSQRRRRAAELSRNRMLSDVGTADVVLVNPTHVAVALVYGDDDPAPRVVARGADHLAARIRAEASRNGVPMLEDRPLARALYKDTRVGQYVPAGLFEAVAVVLAVAWRRSGRMPAGLAGGAAA